MTDTELQSSKKEISTIPDDSRSAQDEMKSNANMSVSSMGEKEQDIPPEFTEKEIIAGIVINMSDVIDEDYGADDNS